MQTDCDIAELRETLVRNFLALQADFDYKYELQIMGIGRLQWGARKRLSHELEALYTALWDLGLRKSFPADHENILELYFASWHPKHDPDAARIRVLQYIDLLKALGDTDFSNVSMHLLSMLEFPESEQKVLNLKLVLQIRHIYRFIFERIL